MNGDGLTDLCAFATATLLFELGYALWCQGAMSHAPHFDHPNQFDQKRIRLAVLTQRRG